MSSMNKTIDDRVIILNEYELPILVGFILLQIVVGSLANITVICMFWERRELRRRPCDLLILSLASADLFSCVTILPWLLHSLLQENLGGSSFFFFASLNVAAIFCCANAITTVTIDRFMAVVYNLRYRVVMTRNKTIRLIVYSWFFAFLVGVGSFISYTLRDEPLTYFEKFLWSLQISELVLVFVIYVVIFRVTWTQSKEISKQRLSVLGLLEQARVALLAKTIWNSFAIVCLFYASFLPFLIYDIVASNADLSKNESRTMLTRFFCFTYISSCINPFIYVFRRKGIFTRRLSPPRASE